MELAGSGVFAPHSVMEYLKGAGLWLQICEKSQSLSITHWVS